MKCVFKVTGDETMNGRRLNNLCVMFNASSDGAKMNLVLSQRHN